MKKTKPEFQDKDPQNPSIEVADIFRCYGAPFRNAHQITENQRRIMFDITDCRTVNMGGHHIQCDQCEYFDISYNSCRNRHCPKCGTLNKVRWLEDRVRDLLPVPYVHGVFTLPHSLNPLIMYNKKIILNALFRMVNATLKTFAQDEKHGLGGDLGYTAVLHTWNQKLFPHFHLHTIIPSGAYRVEDNRWISTPYRFLFPVKALSKVFRGKMVSLLRRAYKSGALAFPDKIAYLKNPETFSGLLSELMEKDWVVYCKQPFKSPKFLLDYLGRYTHRVAISNNRILSMDNGIIRFTYKDRDKNYKTQICQLPADQFIKRFLCHELPSGFMRIRHFGFMGSAIKEKRLNAIRLLLNEKPVLKPKRKKMDAELMLKYTGIDMTCCPKCKHGCLKIFGKFDRNFILPGIREYYPKAG